MLYEPTLLGTSQHDTLLGGSPQDVVVGLAGNDTIESAGGADVIYGDFVGENLLSSPSDATSLVQYAADGQWSVETTADGNARMSQVVSTLNGAQYEVSFELAANYTSGYSAATVTVYWNDVEIGQADTASAVFSDSKFTFMGAGETGVLSFEVAPVVDPDAPQIHSDGPVSYYEKTIEIRGETKTVKAFAEGQAKIFQVMDGKLQVFDPETESYTPAGADATAVANAIGFNVEDDLIYGIAVKNGFDSDGNAVSQSDLVMYDAEGRVYRIGETPYRSWTGDFDGQGNLWYFESDFDRVTEVVPENWTVS